MVFNWFLMKNGVFGPNSSILDQKVQKSEKHSIFIDFEAKRTGIYSESQFSGSEFYLEKILMRNLSKRKKCHNSHGKWS